MKAMWNDIIIAESDKTEVVEGNHYFPVESIKKEYFHKRIKWILKYKVSGMLIYWHLKLVGNAGYNYSL